MIVVVDYGMGNLKSVLKAFEFLGFPVKISSDPAEVQKAKKLVLPGVGAFGDACKELEKRNLFTPLREYLQKKNPFLGICLGMQLLLESSEESPGATGLGIFKGTNRLLPRKTAGGEKVKVPQIGWNRVALSNSQCPLFKNTAKNVFYYFVHSFYACPEKKEIAVGMTDYSVSFPSVLWQENIFATQFHPEKSQKPGLDILKKFAEL